MPERNPGQAAQVPRACTVSMLLAKKKNSTRMLYRCTAYRTHASVSRKVQTEMHIYELYRNNVGLLVCTLYDQNLTKQYMNFEKKEQFGH